MNGHDIAQALERIGVPEGMGLIVTDVSLLIFADGDAATRFSSEDDPETILVLPAHPRAEEAAALLLRAYREVSR